MDHTGGMMRNLAGKADINDGKSPRHYLSAPASSCHDLCKYGKKHNSTLAKRNGGVPAQLTNPEIPNENCSPKKVGTAQARHGGEECRLDTAFQTEDNVCYNSGVNSMTHLQHSDALSELIECMSEESVNMKPRTPSPFLESIITFEQNSSFLEDGSLEESTVNMPEEVPSTFDENIISIDDVPWVWSGGSSDGSAVMELESPRSALESVTSTLTSHGHKLEGSSMEFEVTPRKIISLASGELTHQTKGSSNRCRSMKQETMWNSMTSVIASSSKDATSMKPKEQKQANGLKVDEKRKAQLPMLRSSLPVKTSLLGRVNAKKKVDAVEELGITNEKSPALDRTVISVKPKQAGVMYDKGPRTSLSPIIIKKKTLSPPKRIQLSPKPALLLKTKSSGVKCRSPMSASGKITGQSSQESSKIARNGGMSKLGEEKVLKQFAASQAPKSTFNYTPRLNNRKLRSVKSQVEFGKVDGLKQKTLHVVEQKLVSVAQNSAEQKYIKLRSQQTSRTLSSRSSRSSSAFVSSSYEEENDGSQLTVRDASGSKKTHIGEGKGRTSHHVVEQELLGATLKSAEQRHTKLRSQLSSGSLSSRSSISSSAFVSSSYEEENDGSQLTVSDTSGSKKTHIGEGKGRTSHHVVEQKLLGATLKSAEQKHTKLRSQLSSRTLSSRSSVSSSAFVSSSFEEENDGSQLTISDASGSKKTGTPLFSQKSDCEKVQKGTANVSLEDKSLSLDKMLFRRGKEVSPQRESPDQRRLRFTQSKAVPEADNFEGEIGMSSSRENRESTTANSATVSSGSAAVVPRHQDVQEKNTQALCNDVIEETASKLVETRKSKVKALVSAFESIISFQE